MYKRWLDINQRGKWKKSRARERKRERGREGGREGELGKQLVNGILLNLAMQRCRKGGQHLALFLMVDSESMRTVLRT